MACQRAQEIHTGEVGITAWLEAIGRGLRQLGRDLDERRLITPGESERRSVLFVAHADIGDDRTRIISARKATRRERHGYQEAHRRDR